MSLKIANIEPMSTHEGSLVVVREYDKERDKFTVEEMMMKCDLGQKGKPSLVTDFMGDPICRIRYFSSHVMLVAEYGEARGIVGVIMGCIKTVSRGNEHDYVKLAYILGLRVSPSHRRLGIGKKLVDQLEKWCEQNGADYSYMATDCINKPSINLFTQKSSYTKFRSLSILVQPVHAHYKPLSPSKISIIKLPPPLSSEIYRHVFTQKASIELFPKDIDFILSNTLNIGTFMAFPKKCNSSIAPIRWDPQNGFCNLPQDFALLSVWNTKQVFKLQVTGASKLTSAFCMGTRVLDRCMPWLRLPSFPNVFRQFGVYFLYGLCLGGSRGPMLMKELCTYIHNMAKDDVGCGAVVTEVSQGGPVSEVIPHWRRFSWDEDLWFIKKLKSLDQKNDDKIDCWMKSQSSSSTIFIDPRDF